LDRAVAAGLPRATLDALVARVADPAEGTRLKYRIVPKATYLRQDHLNAAHSQRHGAVGAARTVVTSR
jgi:uncharacterized protein (DUF2384 family)